MTTGREGALTSDQGASLCRAFEEQARRAPDAVALIHRNEFLTYAQLNSEANQLARRLRSRGVGPGARAGLLTGGGPGTFLGLLAILKSGASYVPLTPGTVRERRAGLAVLLVDHRTREAALALAAAGGPLVESVDLMADDGLARSGADLPAEPPRPGRPAVLLFASGPVTPAALLGRLAAERSTAPLRPGAAVLPSAPPESVGSVLEWFPAWQAGGALVVLPAGEAHREPGSLLALLERQQIERWETTSEALRAVGGHLAPGCGRPVLALRDLIVSGPAEEARSALDAWLRACGEDGGGGLACYVRARRG